MLRYKATPCFTVLYLLDETQLFISQTPDSLQREGLVLIFRQPPEECLRDILQQICLELYCTSLIHIDCCPITIII